MPDKKHLDDFLKDENHGYGLQFTVPSEELHHAPRAAREFFERYGTKEIVYEHTVTGTRQSSTFIAEGAKLDVYYSTWADSLDEVKAEFLKMLLRGRQMSDFEQSPNVFVVAADEHTHLKTEILKIFLHKHRRDDIHIKMTGGAGWVQDCLVTINESVMGVESEESMTLFLDSRSHRNEIEYKAIYAAYGDALYSDAG